MCTIKDLKEFLGAKGLTVGETRSLIYKMLDNLDNHSENELLIDNRNNYKGKGLVFHIEKKEINNALSPRAR
jgi:hypothetical protein